jgi:hypothetical protein
MKSNRIVYIDYIRIFACFLVMLVHASEHFYGMVSESAMAGPQSFLADEADRLWVSLYDGFSRMAVPLFMIVSAFLLVPMPQEQTSWEFYKRRIKRVVPPWAFFAILYSTLPLLWGGISSEIATTDLSRLLLNFPTMAGHFWFMYPLVGVYLFIPIISPWLRNATKREEEFFILLNGINDFGKRKELIVTLSCRHDRFIFLVKAELNCLILMAVNDSGKQFGRRKIVENIVGKAKHNHQTFDKARRSVERIMSDADTDQIMFGIFLMRNGFDFRKFHKIRDITKFYG